jgi:D-arabinose 1-dehydrogenase-like Zn-dependent alcohol dehydrogenase
VSEAVLIDAPQALEQWARDHAESIATARTLPDGQDLFDDVILAGRHPSESVEQAFRLLRRNGLLTLVAGQKSRESVVTDAARIHYHGLGLVGAPGPLADVAYGAERNRFDLKPGGSALILGAGGAMGRMHVHRALGMADGPRTIIATSRRGPRLEALLRDFGTLATRRGCELVVVGDDGLGDVLRRRFPEGVDDAVVVAPSIAAIERAADVLAPGGLLVLFAGVSFGQPCRLPLYRVATDGVRITGSTGSTVDDQLSVLRSVMAGTLDPTHNLEAVAGFDAVPDALKAVTEGRVNGKVAIYPGVLGLPLTPIAAFRQASVTGDARWTLEDERTMASRA